MHIDAGQKKDNRFKKFSPENEQTFVKIALIIYVNCSRDTTMKDNSSHSSLAFKLIQKEQNSKSDAQQASAEDSNGVYDNSPVVDPNFDVKGNFEFMEVGFYDELNGESFSFNQEEIASSTLQDEKHKDHTYTSEPPASRQLSAETSNDISRMEEENEEENTAAVITWESTPQKLKENSNFIHFSPALKLIRNGKLLKPKSFGNVIYRYEETSRFDSLMEIFVRAYAHYQRFREFCIINKSNNKTGFLETVINYCQEANVLFLYRYRWDILFEKKF